MIKRIIHTVAFLSALSNHAYSSTEPENAMQRAMRSVGIAAQEANSKMGVHGVLMTAGGYLGTAGPKSVAAVARGWIGQNQPRSFFRTIWDAAGYSVRAKDGRMRVLRTVIPRAVSDTAKYVPFLWIKGFIASSAFELDSDERFVASVFGASLTGALITPTMRWVASSSTGQSFSIRPGPWKGAALSSGIQFGLMSGYEAGARVANVTSKATSTLLREYGVSENKISKIELFIGSAGRFCGMFGGSVLVAPFQLALNVLVDVKSSHLTPRQALYLVMTKGGGAKSGAAGVFTLGSTFASSQMTYLFERFFGWDK